MLINCRNTYFYDLCLKNRIMIKAVFFDIDGTLVSFDTHRIPDSTKEALKILRQKGIKLFIATGRPFGSINNLEGIDFDAYITLNGGYCLAGDGEVIYKSSIPSDNMHALDDYMKDTGIFPCMVAAEGDLSINTIDDAVKSGMGQINFPLPAIKGFEEVKNDEIFQLIIFVDKEKEDFLMKNILAGCESTRWNPLFTDVIKKGNSKQAGMDRLLEYYNIDLKDTIAFGDGGNDISMLKHAAISVAMGNAKDDVKQAASYVTDAVDEDGIWNALKNFSII